MESFLVVSSVLLWLVVLGNLVLTLALIRRINAGSGAMVDEGLEKGETAPDFAAETLDGETVTLATYAGREAAFLFIHPTCGPCRDNLPKYEALASGAARSGVDLILVSSGEAEQTRALVNEFNLQLPVLIAPRGSNPFMETYKLSSTPSYCLITRQGTIETCGHPYLDGGIWKKFAKASETHEHAHTSLAMGERR